MNFVRRTHDTPRIHIYIFFIYANLILRSYTSTIAAAAASARLIRFFFCRIFHHLLLFRNLITNCLHSKRRECGKIRHCDDVNFYELRV